MVLDTSAIVAAIAAEENADRFRGAMLEAPLSRDFSGNCSGVQDRFAISLWSNGGRGI
jgi:uncharacterized protein with PIN domain